MLLFLLVEIQGKPVTPSLFTMEEVENFWKFLPPARRVTFHDLQRGLTLKLAGRTARVV